LKRRKWTLGSKSMAGNYDKKDALRYLNISKYRLSQNEVLEQVQAYAIKQRFAL